MDVFHFQECLEAKNVEDAYMQLKTLCAKSTAVKVDISRISAIDTAGIQLLLVLCEKPAGGMAPVTPSGYSAVVASGLAKLGLRNSNIGRHVDAR